MGREAELIMSQVKIEDVLRGLIETKWEVMSSGSIDAPTGRFMVIVIPESKDERVAMRKDVVDGECEPFDVMESGWYFVIEYSPDHLIFDKCKNQHYALARFALARAAYVDWWDNQTFHNEALGD